MAQSSGGEPGKNRAIDFNLLREWLDQAGKLALSEYRQVDARLKEDGTPVTHTDHAVEAFLTDRISGRYPTHQIITEEGGHYAGDLEYIWIIDPIDGTRAFASQLPVWGISVGLLHNEKPYAGAILLPVIGDMYWAGPAGVFYNGRPLLRRPDIDFDSPLAFIAVPSNAHRAYEIDFPRTRCLGSTVAHLVYVAQGAALGALLRQVSIWDLAGALPILEQAGCQMIYLSGKPFVLSELLDGHKAPEPIVAAHSSHLKRVRDIIRRR